MITPSKDCTLCPRLVQYRTKNKQKHPDYFNGAVPNFGQQNSKFLIVGLAPGISGANKTGRPFTGDAAGNLLYAMLNEFDFSSGNYNATINDGLTLPHTLITNAVRCVPPQNKPNSEEIKECRPFLHSLIANMKSLKVILTLGRVAHESTIASFSLRQKDYPFTHGKAHKINNILLYDSYHCSRYNTNTGRLTEKMFRDVFADIQSALS